MVDVRGRTANETDRQTDRQTTRVVKKVSNLNQNKQV
jgi:hypothetical protein